MKCIKKYFSSEDEHTKVNIEFANFATMSEQFADHESIRNRYDMPPKSWWAIYGAFTPTLQSLAMKLLVQPSSSSCCERNWSTHSFVHSMRRNKTTPQHAEDLVYIHNNLRLLSRRTLEYLKGETKM